MKRLLASAAVVAVLTTATAAFAAPVDVVGKVKSYDAAKHELNLRGKKNADIVYYLPTDLTDPGLKPGVRISLTWDMQDGKHMVSVIALKPKPAKPAKPAKPTTN